MQIQVLANSTIELSSVGSGGAGVSPTHDHERWSVTIGAAILDLFLTLTLPAACR